MREGVAHWHSSGQFLCIARLPLTVHTQDIVSFDSGSLRRHAPLQVQQRQLLLLHSPQNRSVTTLLHWAHLGLVTLAHQFHWVHFVH